MDRNIGEVAMPQLSDRAAVAVAVRNCLQYLLDDVSSAGLSESAVKILDAIRALEEEAPEAFPPEPGGLGRDRLH